MERQEALRLRALLAPQPKLGHDPLFVPGVMARVRRELPPVRRLERWRWTRTAALVLVLVVSWAFFWLGTPAENLGSPVAGGVEAMLVGDRVEWTPADRESMVYDPYEYDGGRVMCRFLPVYGSDEKGVAF